MVYTATAVYCSMYFRKILNLLDLWDWLSILALGKDWLERKKWLSFPLDFSSFFFFVSKSLLIHKISYLSPKHFHLILDARSGPEKRFILILVQILEFFFEIFLLKQSNKKESRVEKKAKINMFPDYSLDDQAFKSSDFF